MIITQYIPKSFEYKIKGRIILLSHRTRGMLASYSAKTTTLYQNRIANIIANIHNLY